ncbi:hypothetical protein MD26_22125 [Pseudomonas sp. H2]|nr:hypothetical protein MD26_22125 [Pseudomonas sp. H2]
MTFLALTRSSAARAALDLKDVENIKADTSMPNTYRPLRVDCGQPRPAAFDPLRPFTDACYRLGVDTLGDPIFLEISSSNAMDFDLEPLILIGRLKVAGDQIKLCVGRSKFMFGTAVTNMQSASTDIVVYLDVVNAMGNLGRVSQAPQPLPILESVGREIQDDCHPGTQHISDERAHHISNLTREAYVIGY